jgi:predicted transcriptional regulator
MSAMMNRTLTISLSSRSVSRARFIAAVKGKRQGDLIVFQRASEIAKLLTSDRVHILESMAVERALSIRQIAELVDRDPEAVYSDVRALTAAGVLDHSEGGIELHYNAIHVDFLIRSGQAPVTS